MNIIENIYEPPRMEIIEVDVEDIILDSTVSGDDLDPYSWKL
jgi:hypothetical protein